ncbi:MAG: hypothetical protein KH301_08105 [Brachyspira sp.]|nr:hypothetical protein [Brachyspira sp.]
MFISFSFIASKRERNEPKKEKNANFTASLCDAKFELLSLNANAFNRSSLTIAQ